MKAKKPVPRDPCPSWQALMINGVFCHETGCPDAWRDYDRNCVMCGFPFRPETRYDRTCGDCASEATS